MISSIPLDSSLFWSNVVAALVLPATWFQFWGAPSKPWVLVANMVTSALFGLSFWLAGAHTAALVSLAAGISAAGQALLVNQTPTSRWVVSIGAIVAALVLAPPDGYFAWLAAGAYAWMRIAETQREVVMRTLVVVSPLLWGLIALDAGNWMAIPVDALGFAMAVRWIVHRLDGQPISEAGPPPEAVCPNCGHAPAPSTSSRFKEEAA